MEDTVLLEEDAAGAGGKVHFAGKVRGVGLSMLRHHAQPSLVRRSSHHCSPLKRDSEGSHVG